MKAGVFGAIGWLALVLVLDVWLLTHHFDWLSTFVVKDLGPYTVPLGMAGGVLSTGVFVMGGIVALILGCRQIVRRR